MDSAAAEDLTQETFVRAYRARERYTPTAPPGAWLRRVGINLAISHPRRQQLAPYLPAPPHLPPAAELLPFPGRLACTSLPTGGTTIGRKLGTSSPRRSQPSARSCEPR